MNKKSLAKKMLPTMKAMGGNRGEKYPLVPIDKQKWERAMSPKTQIKNYNSFLKKYHG